jgi:hypothetical protein
LAEGSEDLELSVMAAIQAARVGSSAGEVAESFVKMRQAEEMARKAGLVTAGMEARFILGTFQFDRLDRVAGRRELESLRNEAQTRGFRRLANRASAALAAPPRSAIVAAR